MLAWYGNYTHYKKRQTHSMLGGYGTSACCYIYYIMYKYIHGNLSFVRIWTAQAHTQTQVVLIHCVTNGYYELNLKGRYHKYFTKGIPNCIFKIYKGALTLIFQNNYWPKSDTWMNWIIVLLYQWICIVTLLMV